MPMKTCSAWGEEAVLESPRAGRRLQMGRFLWMGRRPGGRVALAPEMTIVTMAALMVMYWDVKEVLVKGDDTRRMAGTGTFQQQ